MIAGGTRSRQATCQPPRIRQKAKRYPIGKVGCHRSFPDVHHTWHTDTIFESDLVKSTDHGFKFYQTFSHGLVHFGDIQQNVLQESSDTIKRSCMRDHQTSHFAHRQSNQMSVHQGQKEREKRERERNGVRHERERKGEREKGRKGEREKGRKGEREKGRREKGRKGEREKGRKGERREKGRKGEREKGRKGEWENGRMGEREKKKKKKNIHNVFKIFESDTWVPQTWARRCATQLTVSLATTLRTAREKVIGRGTMPLPSKNNVDSSTLPREHTIADIVS